jgi:limonene-1,2-epoxide hydrolase
MDRRQRGRAARRPGAAMGHWSRGGVVTFRLVHIAANGPVVMTERVDVFTISGRSFELPVMGKFEIRGGKIDSWRDYFDTNQFSARLGSG